MMEELNEKSREENPLDWYSLTENANTILHGLIAYTAREEMKERDKPVPDERRLMELDALFEDVRRINDEPESFQSKERLQEIIIKYGGLLKDLNQ